MLRSVLLSLSLCFVFACSEVAADGTGNESDSIADLYSNDATTNGSGEDSSDEVASEPVQISGSHLHCSYLEPVDTKGERSIIGCDVRVDGVEASKLADDLIFSAISETGDTVELTKHHAVRDSKYSIHFATSTTNLSLTIHAKSNQVKNPINLEFVLPPCSFCLVTVELAKALTIENEYLGLNRKLMAHELKLRRAHGELTRVMVNSDSYTELVWERYNEVQNEADELQNVAHQKQALANQVRSDAFMHKASHAHADQVQHTAHKHQRTANVEHEKADRYRAGAFEISKLWRDPQRNLFISAIDILEQFVSDSKSTVSKAELVSSEKQILMNLYKAIPCFREIAQAGDYIDCEADPSYQAAIKSFEESYDNFEKNFGMQELQIALTSVAQQTNPDELEISFKPLFEKSYGYYCTVGDSVFKRNEAMYDNIRVLDNICSEEADDWFEKTIQ